MIKTQTNWPKSLKIEFHQKIAKKQQKKTTKKPHSFIIKTEINNKRKEGERERKERAEIQKSMRRESA
jgi:hypothetical protein